MTRDPSELWDNRRDLPQPANTNQPWEDWEVIWCDCGGHPVPVVLLDDGELRDIIDRNGF